MKINILEVGSHNNFTPAGYVEDEEDEDVQKRAIIDQPVIYTEKKHKNVSLAIRIKKCERP